MLQSGGICCKLKAIIRYFKINSSGYNLAVLQVVSLLLKEMTKRGLPFWGGEFTTKSIFNDHLNDCNYFNKFFRRENYIPETALFIVISLPNDTALL
jgi:hypothetical protein